MAFKAILSFILLLTTSIAIGSTGSSDLATILTDGIEAPVIMANTSQTPVLHEARASYTSNLGDSGLSMTAEEVWSATLKPERGSLALVAFGLFALVATRRTKRSDELRR